MKTFMKAVLCQLLLLGTAVYAQSTPVADKTETFECPQGSFISNLSGNFQQFINGIQATCSDEKKTVSKYYGRNGGSNFTLPYDKDGITKITVHQDNFVDSIGYDGVLVGGPMSYRIVEFVDIQGCAAVGFTVTYSESLRHIKFKFSCVNNAIVVPADMRLVDYNLTPKNCPLCIGPISVSQSTRVHYLARVLRLCHDRFKNLQNAYAVAQSLENGALAQHPQAMAVVKVLIGAGNEEKCSPMATSVTNVLSAGRYMGTPRDAVMFDKVYYDSDMGKDLPWCDSMDDETLPYCDAMEDEMPYCDEDRYDEYGTPYCDAMDRNSTAPYETLPFCDEVDNTYVPVEYEDYQSTRPSYGFPQDQYDETLPYCDEYDQSYGAPGSDMICEDDDLECDGYGPNGPSYGPNGPSYGPNGPSYGVAPGEPGFECAPNDLDCDGIPDDQYGSQPTGPFQPQQFCAPNDLDCDGFPDSQQDDFCDANDVYCDEASGDQIPFSPSRFFFKKPNDKKDKKMDCEDCVDDIPANEVSFDIVDDSAAELVKTSQTAKASASGRVGIKVDKSAYGNAVAKASASAKAGTGSFGKLGLGKGSATGVAFGQGSASASASGSASVSGTLKEDEDCDCDDDMKSGKKGKKSTSNY